MGNVKRSGIPTARTFATLTKLSTVRLAPFSILLVYCTLTSSRSAKASLVMPRCSRSSPMRLPRFGMTVRESSAGTRPRLTGDERTQNQPRGFKV